MFRAAMIAMSFVLPERCNGAWEEFMCSITFAASTARLERDWIPCPMLSLFKSRPVRRQNGPVPRQTICIVPILAPEFGGIHQYTITLLRALSALKLPEQLSFVLLLRNGDEDLLPKDIPEQWRRLVINGPLDWRSSLNEAEARSIKCANEAKGATIRINHNKKLCEFLHENQIDWLFLTAPVALGFEAGLPYIMPVHDLQHRRESKFPEVSAEGQWHLREYLYSHGIANASYLLVDSIVGLEDVVELYGADHNKCIVVPFAPASPSSSNATKLSDSCIADDRDLPERFLFYPAKFWPHKNHCRIVEALWVARRYGVDINVVFCGDNTSCGKTLETMNYVAGKLDVTSNIRILGYISDEDVYSLYVKASGLVMPTFFGPTNTPVVEAWACDCPVLTSNIRGIREQVGTAALLVDPYSVNSIAAGMIRLWSDNKLRRELIESGRDRLSHVVLEKFGLRVRELILTMAQNSQDKAKSKKWRSMA